MSQKIRILLADDHVVVRQGFKLILGAQPDMEIVGEAGNGREAVELAEKLHPDVAVVDVAMPELNGIEATRRMAEVAPRTRVLALSMHKDSVYVREILRAGARGYLLKDAIDSDSRITRCELRPVSCEYQEGTGGKPGAVREGKRDAG